MTTPDSQERLKQEAKALRARIEGLIRAGDAQARIVRTVCIYAGLLTETLLDYEEPDIVMEQAFFRIADLLRVEPAAEFDKARFLPLPWVVDHDTELGRQLARAVSGKLPRGMDDLHEIAIALAFSDIPVWDKQGYPAAELLRLMVETVIMSLTFEMATQDFCDLLVEDYISDGAATGEALLGLAAVAGFYYAAADRLVVLPPEAEQDLTNVMVRESLLHGTPGSRNWRVLAAANDGEYCSIDKYMENLKGEIAEFLDLIGLDDPAARAVAVAKAVGRMVAVITVEDVGQMHPSIAKSLAKTGMILGSKYRVDPVN